VSSRLRDQLEQLEAALQRNSGTGEDAYLSRRLELRKVLTAWGDARWEEGHSDGMHDVWDARRAAADADAAERTREPLEGEP
jgi:hypothetical protein